MTAAPQAEALAIESADELVALSGETLIRAAYLAILGRPADEAGLQSHLRLLRGGEDPRALLLALCESKEAKQRTEDGLADLTGLVVRLKRDKPSRWLHAVQTRIARLLGPLFNRLAVIDDQIARLEVRQRKESLRLDTLLAQGADQLERLDQLCGNTPTVASSVKHSEVEQRQFSRMSREAQEVYLEMKELLRRRQATVSA